MGYREQIETQIDSELLNIAAAKDAIELISSASGSSLRIDSSLPQDELCAYVNKYLLHTYEPTHRLWGPIRPKKQKRWFRRSTTL